MKKATEMGLNLGLLIQKPNFTDFVKEKKYK